MKHIFLLIISSVVLTLPVFAQEANEPDGSTEHQRLGVEKERPFQLRLGMDMGLMPGFDSSSFPSVYSAFGLNSGISIDAQIENKLGIALSLPFPIHLSQNPDLPSAIYLGNPGLQVSWREPVANWRLQPWVQVQFPSESLFSDDETLGSRMGNISIPSQFWNLRAGFAAMAIVDPTVIDLSLGYSASLPSTDWTAGYQPLNLDLGSAIRFILNDLVSVNIGVGQSFSAGTYDSKDADGNAIDPQWSFGTSISGGWSFSWPEGSVTVSISQQVAPSLGPVRLSVSGSLLVVGRD